MLGLEQTIRQNKRKAAIAIAGAAAVVVAAAAALLTASGLLPIPVSFSSATEGVSETFATLSESANSAVTSARSALGL